MSTLVKSLASRSTSATSNPIFLHPTNCCWYSQPCHPCQDPAAILGPFFKLNINRNIRERVIDSLGELSTVKRKKTPRCSRSSVFFVLDDKHDSSRHISASQEANTQSWTQQTRQKLQNQTSQHHSARRRNQFRETTEKLGTSKIPQPHSITSFHIRISSARPARAAAAGTSTD